MLDICGKFRLNAPAVSCEPYGGGHINTTYLVKTEGGADYILQRVSRQAFHDIPALMHNIEKVTRHIAAKEPDPRRSLRLVPTRDGESFLRSQDGECYRVYDFITDSVSLDRPERDNDLYECAHAFGRFQRMMSDFPAAELSETIPSFHDTPARYVALKAAIAADVMRRADSCRKEIDFALAREKDASALMDMLRRGELPLKVTHNDTKLNNVMLDKATHEAVCVIDLDTVMPGLAANDFGDLVRFGANTGAEDEKDLSRIGLSLSAYDKLLKGFMDACGSSLTKGEAASLPIGGRLMTLECGVRFLTDYLMGDVYFHIKRPEHNLDRARTQLKLVEDIEAKWDAIAR